MELKSTTRQFGDVKVTVQEFDAWRGFQLLPRLGAVLGPMAPDASGNIDVGKGISEMCAAVSADSDLLLAMLGSTTCLVDDNEFVISDKVHINLAFNGQMWAMAEVLGMVMEASFTDFLSNALSAIDSLSPDPEAKAPSESSSD